MTRDSKDIIHLANEIRACGKNDDYVMTLSDVADIADVLHRKGDRAEDLIINARSGRRYLCEHDEWVEDIDNKMTARAA